MGFSIEDFLAQFMGVFGTVGTVAMNLFQNMFGYMQGAFGSGSMPTGIAIGFVLALFFRGIMMKLLIGGILVVVFMNIFGLPG